MNAALQLAALGLATGSLYGLSALGVLVVYRSSGVLNLANGAFAMLAGYTFFTLHDEHGVSTPLAATVGILAACVLALLVYVVVMRPLALASTLTKLVATLGVYLVAQSVIQLIFGSFNKVPSQYLPTEAVDLGPIELGRDQIIIIGIAALLAAGLWVVYRYTRFGRATTAVAENPRALEALGHDVDILRAVNWVVAGALGGVSGVLIAPVTQLTPTTFLLFLIPSLAAAVLGGMRSFPITLVAGMLLGSAQVLSTRYIDTAGARDAVPFLVIIIVLVLLGRGLPGRAFITERLPRVGSGAVNPVRLAAACAVVLFLGLNVFDDGMVIGTIVLGAVGIIAMSQVVITGYAGQVSLAQTTMAGIGGLIAAQVSVKAGMPFIVCLLAGAFAVIPIGVLVGLPALRARGATLAIATLGFAVAVNGMVLNNSDLNGGVLGLPIESPSIFGLDLNPILSIRNYLIVVLVAVVLVGLMIANLRRGRAGRRLLALRTNERAAAALGINVTVAKLYAFTLAAFIAAIGGTLLLFRNPTVIVSSGFDVFSSVSSVAFGVLGGIGYIPGALIAAGFNSGSLPTVAIGELSGTLDIQDKLNVWFPLVGGLGLLIQVIVQPAGAVDAIVHPPKKKKKAAAATARPEALPGTGSEPSRLAKVVGTRAARSSATQREISRLLENARGEQRSFRGASLTARDITVRYGSVTAVSDVSFEVHPGEVLSIIGPNGAGKTSLMDALTGFCSAQGTVQLGDKRIESWAAYRRARAGLVRSFQNLELLEDMNVLDNLRVAEDPQDFASYLIDLFHPKRGTLSPATAAAVRCFHLEKVLDRVPDDLPYGDRRLVAIARAVAGEPSVLLLDEPAAGLSETERAEVASLIRMIATDWNIAVLLIEHDVELVRRVSDRVLALDFGKPIATGTPDEVLGHPRVIEAYLGHAADPVDDVPDDTSATTPMTEAAR